MKVPFIIGSGGVTLFINGKPKKINANHEKYNKVLDLLADSCEVEEILAELERSEELAEVGVNLEEDTFRDVPLHPALSSKLKQIVADGLPLQGMVEFFNNLDENPSAESVKSLLKFLEKNQLPITADGHFIAYKGVRDDGYSVTGNQNTIVLNGEVDSGGRILNTIGETISVKRNQVDEDINQSCSFGLHVGSYNYANGFGSRLLVAKVNPRDVVAVPHADAEKCRVCEYEVLDLADGEIAEPVVSEDGDDVTSEWREYVNRVADILERGNGDRYNFSGVLSQVSELNEQKLELILGELEYDIGFNPVTNKRYVKLNSVGKDVPSFTPEFIDTVVEDKVDPAPDEDSVDPVDEKNAKAWLDSEISVNKAGYTNPTIGALWAGLQNVGLSFDALQIELMVAQLGYEVVPAEDRDWSYVKLYEPLALEVWNLVKDKDSIKVSDIYNPLANSEFRGQISEAVIMNALDDLGLEYDTSGGLFGTVIEFV